VKALVKPFLDWLVEKYGNAEGMRRFREWQKEI